MEARVPPLEELRSRPAGTQETTEDEAGVGGVVASKAVLVDGGEVLEELGGRGEGEAEVP